MEPCSPALRLLLLLVGLVNCQQEVRNLPKFNALPYMMCRYREGQTTYTQGSGAENQAPALLPTEVFRVQLPQAHQRDGT